MTILGFVFWFILLEINYLEDSIYKQCLLMDKFHKTWSDTYNNFLFDNCKTVCKRKTYKRHYSDNCLKIELALIVDENITINKICIFSVNNSLDPGQSRQTIQSHDLRDTEINKFTTPSYVDQYCMNTFKQWQFTSVINTVSQPKNVTIFNVNLDSIFAMTEITSQSLESMKVTSVEYLVCCLEQVVSLLKIVYSLCCSLRLWSEIFRQSWNLISTFSFIEVALIDLIFSTFVYSLFINLINQFLITQMRQIFFSVQGRNVTQLPQ